MAVLITGGLGYIGSHTAVELLNKGRDIVIIDDLYNSKIVVKNRIEEITGREVKFYNIDLLDIEKVEKVFQENYIDSVIHFAAYKAVGESTREPLKYYYNNMTSMFSVLKTMKKYKVNDFIFSSSATVYGMNNIMPVKEYFPLSVTNPYGRTKLMGEEVLRDLYNSDNSWNIGILRYFNPVGAHESGLIGEDPNGIPSNIMPYISKVAVGELKVVSVFGDDYDTPDGTGVRDYIHVVDIAKGHIAVLDKLKKKPGLVTYNLGTGKGYSVLELIRAFSKASGIDIPYKIVGRREGDVAKCYSDPNKANKELGWFAKKVIEEMCKDSWNWQKNNPKGYI
ncbi:UDP-galactose 4-epimerase [Clostridium sp. DSM 8431]|uniref:UDP-glucose 4-epimerase GalE n=1 Tax=Clostridium sp. DSM 8431 TaxID=1761781 RepID=UPI0008E478A5|nr:UDP-glucose 4-epimerase GalE [Clostridium sp. DSM 8431]SFU37866.1 UDP-galactose 4-epimerase [Clostridium sp. DSM 8431]